jgi:hypothetical protein
MFSKISLALGVVLAISALGKKIYKFSMIESQCLITTFSLQYALSRARYLIIIGNSSCL